MAYINGNEVLDAIIVKRLNTPTETLEITENGEYDVIDYATVIVNVPSGINATSNLLNVTTDVQEVA